MTINQNNNRIIAITPFTNRNKIFKEFISRMDPKPDLLITYNEKEYITDSSLKSKLWKVACNYNLLKKLTPKENYDYVYIMEDDVEVPINILNIFLKNMNDNKSIDIISTSVMCRNANKRMVWNIDHETNFVKTYTGDSIGIKKVGCTSLNSFLIKRKPFKKSIFLGQDESHKLTVDTLYFYYLNCLGYNTYCNFDIPTIHDDKNIWGGKLSNFDRNQIIKYIRKVPL